VGKLIGQCTPFSSFNYSNDSATGFPDTKECLTRNFGTYYQTPDVASAWEHFYHYKEVQAKFRAFWNITASAFVGAPGVLGYDLLNEPLGGDFFQDGSLLEPGVADLLVLAPIYKTLYEDILSVDPEAIIMYEPTPFPDTYPVRIPVEGGVHPMGFVSGPAGENHKQQSLS